MTQSPVLGLIVDRPPAAPLYPLLADLRRWCRPLVPAPEVGPIRAWMTTSLRSMPHGAGKVGAWVAHAHELDVDPTSRATLLLTDDAGVADAAGDRAVVVNGTVNSRDVVPLTPFVRERARAGLGLPSGLVVEVGPTEARVHPGGPLDPDLALTALCLSAAAAVTGPALVEALLWGTPCVTDPATADLIGAVDGRDVVVAPADGRLAAACALVRQRTTAAVLARNGRRLVELQHDRAAVADRVRTALLGEGGQPAAVMAHRMDVLRTPITAEIRRRAASAVAPFIPSETAALVAQ